jgi:uncharacterized protein (TIGR02594 family)
MVQVFEVIKPDADIPMILAKPEVTAELIEQLVEGNLVYLSDVAEDANAPTGWRSGEYRPIPTAKGDPGWIQTKFIGNPAQLSVPPVPIADLVRRCGRAEIQGAAGGSDGAPAVLADYLIALAFIETELTKFENRLPGTSALGPFQITEEEWADFLAANPDGDFSPYQRYLALVQVQGAVFLTQRDWNTLQEEAGAAGITEPAQNYIPSFLLLFQSRLIGAKAAFAVDKLHAGDGLHTPIRDALAPFFPDPSELDGVLKRRQRFLNQGSADIVTTVDEFVEKTANILADAFKTAFTLLKTHFPEFAAVPDTPGDKPWVATAQHEEVDWLDANVRETTPAGQQKIRDYFNATSYHPTVVEPWCGAFAAWCMQQNNSPEVRDAETASNWKAWGTAELRKGALSDKKFADAIFGAVVVLHPGMGTGTTGHVCFAINRIETADKLKCIGGNQSDTVRTDTYDISRVASIRVLAQITSPAGNDQLILARTIYGEAAGEPDEGKRAVAQVVMNRAASGRYPQSVTGVCLQPSQFSCWNANDPNRNKIIGLQPNGDKVFNVCFAIAGDALAGNINVLTPAVMHYFADYISKPSWVLRSPNAFMEKKIGHHLFYRGIA